MRTATLSVLETAAVLQRPSWWVRVEIAEGRLPAWSLDSSGPRRVGWRALARDVRQRFAGDERRVDAALADIDAIRRGDLAATGHVEPPELVSVELVRPNPRPIGTSDEVLEVMREALHGKTGSHVSMPAAARLLRPYGLTPAQVCRTLGLTWSELLDRVGCRPLERPSDGASSRVERLAWLETAAHDVGGASLSIHAFDRWATARSAPVTAAAVIGMFGSWNAAKMACGLPTEARRRRRDVSDADLVAHLQACAAALKDDAVTTAQFDAWAQERGLGVRLSNLVTSRFGTWNAAKDRAGLEARPQGYQRRIGRGDR